MVDGTVCFFAVAIRDDDIYKIVLTNASRDTLDSSEDGKVVDHLVWRKVRWKGIGSDIEESFLVELVQRGFRHILRSLGVLKRLHEECDFVLVIVLQIL